MEIKDIAKAAYDWAEQDDNKRTILLITSELKNETEEGGILVSSKTVNGKINQMIEALVDNMKDDKGLAKVITKAFLAYNMGYSTPIGIVVTSIKGKEGEDE